MQQFTVVYRKYFTEIFVLGVKISVYNDSNITFFWDNIV